MRDATTVLNILRDRGQRGLPVNNLYRLLYSRNLYLRAYAKLYPNKGALTAGANNDTVDAMSLTKIDRIIAALRQERYRWTPIRRPYIPKRDVGTSRPGPAFLVGQITARSHPLDPGSLLRATIQRAFPWLSPR